MLGFVEIIVVSRAHTAKCTTPKLHTGHTRRYRKGARQEELEAQDIIKAETGRVGPAELGALHPLSPTLEGENRCARGGARFLVTHLGPLKQHKHG